MIAVFDLGRTHKKFLLFNEDYKVVDEVTVAIPDIRDEDNDACEDWEAITAWMKVQLNNALSNPECDIKAVNFSAHGASFVHIDQNGQPATPLYDYMKPLDKQFTSSFYELFGGENSFSIATGSPVLNMLNSGIQLYWLKENKPDYFRKIKTSLHLPQYGNYIFSGKKHADITSIGCHTGLWDFDKNQYHQWLSDEGVIQLLPKPESVMVFDDVSFNDKTIAVGVGMHDSSAALLPFVNTAEEPFVLLSTGTWNITLNPYFKGTLSDDEYTKDCLYFLLEINRKVAASRLFLGNEYDFQLKKLKTWFGKGKEDIEVHLDEMLLQKVLNNVTAGKYFYPEAMTGTGPFEYNKEVPVDLSNFDTYEEAYHQLILDLAYMQKESVELISGPIKRLYISGGFVRNTMFMEFLQAFLPDWELFIAENKRASALGAAMAMHEVWQTKPLSKKVSPVIPFKKQSELNLSLYEIPGLKS